MKSPVRIAFLAALPFAFGATARAQTPSTNLAGAALINNSTVHGGASGLYSGGDILTSTAYGSHNTQNGYGGYSSITATLPVPDINTGGLLQITSGSTVYGSGLALGTTGSALDTSAVGKMNLADSVGQVTKETFVSTGPTIIQQSLGYDYVGGSTVKGDLTALGINETVAGGSAIGKKNTGNDYGRLFDITATLSPSAPNATGVLSLNASTVGHQVLAAAMEMTVSSAASFGNGNVTRPVGFVDQFQVNTAGLMPSSTP